VFLAFFIIGTGRWESLYLSAASAAITFVPAFEIGWTQRLFGSAEGYVLNLASVVALFCMLRFLQIEFDVGNRAKWRYLLVGSFALGSLPTVNPFRGVLWGTRVSVVVMGILIVEYAVSRIRTARRRPQPTYGVFLRAGIALTGATVFPDIAANLGFGRLAREWHIFSSGLVGVVLMFSAAYAWEFFETYKRAGSLQRSLAERVKELESTTREVQSLNLDLRRQLETNASRLAQALVRASVAPPLRQMGTGDVVNQRYRIEAVLGSGGMGTVYRVSRLDTGAALALKLITGQQDPMVMARFAREAESALRIENPHVVGVRDVGTTADGQLFIVMDLVDGPTLSKETSHYGEPVWALDVLAQVARGLRAIHEAGVIHRDIKPSNVILSYGEGTGGMIARISDFGVSARSTDSQSARGETQATYASLTKSGHMVGTPLYMAPEAHEGLEITTAADMFSFGVMARQVLGIRVGLAIPPGLLLATTDAYKPEPLSQSCQILDRRAAEVLDACLAKEPEARPSAATVEAALLATLSLYASASDVRLKERRVV
jgi:tRNA A-37 threonylcarbamoyl transferase component Bud32